MRKVSQINFVLSGLK